MSDTDDTDEGTAQERALYLSEQGRLSCVRADEIGQAVHFAAVAAGLATGRELATLTVVMVAIEATEVGQALHIESRPVVRFTTRGGPSPATLYAAMLGALAEHDPALLKPVADTAAIVAAAHEHRALKLDTCTCRVCCAMRAAEREAEGDDNG